MVNLESPVNQTLICMSLDCGRKPESSEKTHTDEERNIQTPHKKKWKGFNLNKILACAARQSIGPLDSVVATWSYEPKSQKLLLWLNCHHNQENLRPKQQQQQQSSSFCSGLGTVSPAVWFFIPGETLWALFAYWAYFPSFFLPTELVTLIKVLVIKMQSGCHRGLWFA